MMKRIAVLSDIHANMPALEAVWADMKSEDIKECYHLGDLVGYNPFPTEVVAFIKKKGVPGVVGNYDLAVATSISDPVSAYLKPTISETGRAAYTWTVDHVQAEDRRYLMNLPSSLNLTLSGLKLTLVHGSTESVKEYLYPDTPEERLEALLEKTAANILLCGHTHLPMIRRTRSGLVINPGSVGKPKDGDPRASYVILEMAQGHVETVFRRVEYSVAEVVAATHRSGLPQAMAVSLEKGASA